MYYSRHGHAVIAILNTLLVYYYYHWFDDRSLYKNQGFHDPVFIGIVAKDLFNFTITELLLNTRSEDIHLLALTMLSQNSSVMLHCKI